MFEMIMLAAVAAMCIHAKAHPDKTPEIKHAPLEQLSQG